MANHYSDMGIEVEGEEAFNDFINDIYESATPNHFKFGSYLHYDYASQISFDLIVDDKKQIRDVFFHYDTNHKNDVVISEILHDGDDKKFKNMLVVYPKPYIPIYLIVPNIHLYPKLIETDKIDIQIAAFVTVADTFSNKDQYLKVIEENGYKEETILPIGIMENKKISDTIICGKILEIEKRTNEVTNLDYYYLKVESKEVIFDVLASPEFIQLPLSKNKYFFGECFLSGKIKD